MRERFRPSSVFAPVDRRALLRFAASCLSEIIVTYLYGWLPILNYHVQQGKAGAEGLGSEVGLALGYCRDWGCGSLEKYFHRT